jgi:isopenicillin-N N-acyltransferase-like protein
MASPPLFIEVSGPPRSRGQSYGEAARDRIRLGVEHYAAQIGRHGLSNGVRRELCEGFLPTIRAFDAGHADEIEGIAAGAGVPVGDVVLLNARTEVLQIAERDGGPAPSVEGVDGCTGVIVLPEASADGRLIHAMNWDWKADCADTAVVLRIRGSDADGSGPDILTFAEAGQLARAGLNAAGIAITANYLESDRDYRQSGVPLALLRRKVLQQHQLAAALRVAYCTPKSASNNIMISQAGGIGLDLECAPDETFLVHARDGLIVHANHWQSPVALTRLRDTGIAATPDSLYRDLRVQGALAPLRGAIDSDAVKAALFDDYQSPDAVCRPPRRGASGNLSATVAMIVMIPAEGRMEVAMLPALNRDFTEFMLSGGSASPNNGPAHAPDPTRPSPDRRALS